MALSSSSSVGPSLAIALISFSMTSIVSPVASVRVAVPPMLHCRVVEPEQTVGDAVGEPALLAHLAIEPRGERAAAEDVIDDVGGHEIRIVARDARAAERHHGLRHIEIDDDAAAEALRSSRRRPACSLALAGSAPKVWSMSRPAVAASMSPTTAILSVSRAKHVAQVGLQVVDGDARHRLERAVGRAPIGMAGKGGAPPGAAGDVVRARGLRAAAAT